MRRRFANRSYLETIKGLLNFSDGKQDSPSHAPKGDHAARLPLA